jgi:hypothetical protein
MASCNLDLRLRDLGATPGDDSPPAERVRSNFGMQGTPISVVLLFDRLAGALDARR